MNFGGCDYEKKTVSWYFDDNGADECIPNPHLGGGGRFRNDQMRKKTVKRIVYTWRAYCVS